MKKLLIILGPTSTGKTDLALFLAQKYNGELISADSRQVYKYLDIGTGKEVGRKYQVSRDKGYWVVNGTKIWMYDEVDPKKRFSLYQYVLKAEETIDKISSEKKLPILVGGTGFYIRSLIEGVSDSGISENKPLRDEFEKFSLEEIKKRIDPKVLGGLNNSELSNKRRLIRLAEKLLASSPSESFKGLREGFDILKIGLKIEKEILSKKINERVINRLKEGMIEESEQLLGKKILSFSRMEELGLEYKYIAKFLKGEIKTKEELIDILSLKIRQFAKRQMTWFKKEKEVFWFDISSKDYLQNIDYQVSNWYNNRDE